MDSRLFAAAIEDATAIAREHPTEESDQWFLQIGKMCRDERFCRAELNKSAKSEFKKKVRSLTFEQLQEVCRQVMKIINTVKNERKEKE